MFTSGFTKIVLRQMGGAKKGVNPFLVVLAVMAIFVVKSAIVMFTYNMVGPKLVCNCGNDHTKFRPLTLTESMALTLLFNAILH